jgi:hypothetical protein
MTNAQIISSVAAKLTEASAALKDASILLRGSGTSGAGERYADRLHYEAETYAMSAANLAKPLPENSSGAAQALPQS